MQDVTPSYVVKLQNFTGPLDLLLQLIKKRKLDICDISLSTVTSDFVTHIGSQEMSEHDTNSFVDIASKLIVQKSRALLPNDQVDEEDEQPQITEHLKQFAAYKRAAGQLGSAMSTPHLARPYVIDELPARGYRSLKPEQLGTLAKSLFDKDQPEKHTFRLKRPAQIDLRNKMIARLLASKQVLIADIASLGSTTTERIVLFGIILEFLKSGRAQLNNNASVVTL